MSTGVELELVWEEGIRLSGQDSVTEYIETWTVIESRGDNKEFRVYTHHILLINDIGIDVPRVRQVYQTRHYRLALIQLGLVECFGQDLDTSLYGSS